MKIVLLITSFLSFFLSSLAQDSTTTQNKKLPSMAEEISNLTRKPLGDGTLKFENFIMYTVEESGKSRAGKIYFSDNHEAVVWLEDLNHEKSLFFRASQDSPIITITPSINQGAEISPKMIKALGYSRNTESTKVYIIDKKSPLDTIANSECQPAIAMLEESEHTMWVAAKKSFKKPDRLMLERGISLIFNNQTRTPFLSSAIIKSSWIPMGYNCDSYEFRILNWRLDGDFKLEQGDIMIKILGLDLQQVAKQYLEELDKENSLQKED
ncbi:MAG TPA: hypothetical protein EYF95_07395 [Flavobacteriales bacterium]|nr:hypothetical protein [Flavobacteriales bacterium]